MREDKYQEVRDFIQEKHATLPFPDKSYLILMSPRSGSNLLCAHLIKIDFGNPIEAFHKPKNLKNLYHWEIDFSDPYQRFKKAMEFQTVNGVFGMKMNWDQFDLMIQLGRQLIDDKKFKLSDAEVVEVFFPNLSLIRLKRKNKVKQAISYSKGMQTGVWVIPTGGLGEKQDYILPPQYDRDHIEVCLEKLFSYHYLWESFLEIYSMNYFELWYEDLASDFKDTMKQIYQFLQIESDFFPEAQTKKIANKQTDDWYERFIAETPWLKDKEIADSLANGDFSKALIRRSLLHLAEREDVIFENAPFNKFKKSDTTVCV